MATSRVSEKQVTQSHVSHPDNILGKPADSSSTEPRTSNKGNLLPEQVEQSHVSHSDNTLEKPANSSSTEPRISSLSFNEKIKRGFNILFGGETTSKTTRCSGQPKEVSFVVGKKARTNQSSKPEKVTLVIEMARLPALMVVIDKSKTITQLKVSYSFEIRANK